MNSTIKRILTSRRTATVAAVTVVAGVAGYSSYGHQYDVAILAHQAPALAAVFPFSVDGMLLAASLAIAEDKANGLKPRPWAMVAFWLGAAVSVAANVASIFLHWGVDPVAIAISAWPPVALLFTVEVISRSGKAPKPEKNPNRVEGGRRAAAKRTSAAKPASIAKQTRKPRAPKAPATAAQANAMLAVAGAAPTSPAPVGS